MVNKPTMSRKSSHANPAETEGGMLAQAGRKIATGASEFGSDFFKQLLNLDTHKGEAADQDIEPPVDAAKNLGYIFDSHANADPDTSVASAIKRNYRFAKRQSENQPKAEARKRPESRAAIEYHEQFSRQVMDYDRKASHRQTQELSQQIQEIVAELRKLIKSSNNLQLQFAEVVMETGPVEVGKYHVSFFEWMLIVIKQAKQKVDDAGAWMSTMKGKNGKKSSGYWDMFKKHGTSFGLSNERSVATQVG